MTRSVPGSGGRRHSRSHGPAPQSLRRRAPLVVVALAGLLVIDLLGSCGKKGAPIPPEDLGVAVKQEQERQQAASEKTAGTAARDPQPEGDEETGETDPGTRELPPLRPLATP